MYSFDTGHVYNSVNGKGIQSRSLNAAGHVRVFLCHDRAVHTGRAGRAVELGPLGWGVVERTGTQTMCWWRTGPGE